MYTAIVESSDEWEMRGWWFSRRRHDSTHSHSHTQTNDKHQRYTSNKTNTTKISNNHHNSLNIFWELEYKLWIINFPVVGQECVRGNAAVAVSMSFKPFCCYYNYVSIGIINNFSLSLSLVCCAALCVGKSIRKLWPRVGYSFQRSLYMQRNKNICRYRIEIKLFPTSTHTHTRTHNEMIQSKN